MAGFGQYLRDTRGELRHVAWPTRTQTIVYTVLVALLSVGVALYLGLFDFIFTSGLSRALQVLPGSLPSVSEISTTSTPVTPVTISTSSSSQAPTTPSPTVNFKIPGQQ